MCLGIPMEVTAVDGNLASCRGRFGVAQVDATLVVPVAVGDWLLTSLGSARMKLDALDAARIDRALDALDAVERGEVDLSRFFADLVDREPPLPGHLRSET